MKLPILGPVKTVRKVTDSFDGLDLTSADHDNAFAKAMNVSSARWPALTVRDKRRLEGEYTDVKAICYAGSQVLIDGTDVYVGGVKVAGLTLSAGDKKTVTVGRRVYIFPDKVYVDTESPVSFGQMEEEASFSSGYLLIEPAIRAYASAPYSRSPVQPSPQDPADMEGWFWMDTSASPCKLYKYVYNGSSGSFTEVGYDCTRIVAISAGMDLVTNAFDCFEVGDGVRLSGTGSAANAITALGLEGDHIVINRAQGMLVLNVRTADYRQLSLGAAPLDGSASVKRKVPDLDMAVYAGNRIWGCSVSGNRIYASRYGSPCSWFGSDSNTADPLNIPAGTPGDFTGAAVIGGNPVFFKEDHIHKISGLSQLAISAAGVRRGCGASLAQVGDALCYVSEGGICAYKGGAPYSVSRELGRIECTSAVAGALGGKYYLFIKKNGVSRTLVYDSTREVWFEEDPLPAKAVESHGGTLYAALDDNSVTSIGGGSGTPEGDIAWYLESRDVRTRSGGRKLLSRIAVRAKLDPGAHASVYVSYDDSDGRVFVGGLSDGLTAVNLRSRKSDNVRLYIEGVGGCTIFSVSRSYTEAEEFG